MTRALTSIGCVAWLLTIVGCAQGHDVPFERRDFSNLVAVRAGVEAGAYLVDSNEELQGLFSSPDIPSVMADDPIDWAEEMAFVLITEGSGCEPYQPGLIFLLHLDGDGRLRVTPQCGVGNDCSSLQQLFEVVVMSRSNGSEHVFIAACRYYGR